MRYVILFLFGASLGSFLNVVSLRFLSGESFLLNRSYCPHCRKKLAWFELIPIISFFLIRGRCRNCQAKVSFRYLLAEVGMGAFLVLLGAGALNGTLAAPFHAMEAAWGVWPLLFLYSLAGALLFIIFLVDLDSQTIPVFALYGLIAAAGLAFGAELILGGSVRSLGWVLGTASLIGIFFLSLWLFTKGRGMGTGDAELAFVTSLYLVPPAAVLFVLFSFWLGALCAIGLLASREYRLKSRIPFGPFLVLGFFAALFWGRIALPYLFPFV